MAELTPMKRQYNEIKSKHEDCLLFFRLGDFYEMFDEDAKLASKELDLALTTRDRNVENPDERTPMCGVPYHSAEAYIARLIAKGYKIAICEQTEDPGAGQGPCPAGRYPHHHPWHGHRELHAAGGAEQLYLLRVSEQRPGRGRFLRYLHGRILLRRLRERRGFPYPQ